MTPFIVNLQCRTGSDNISYVIKKHTKIYLTVKDTLWGFSILRG